MAGEPCHRAVYVIHELSVLRVGHEPHHGWVALRPLLRDTLNDEAASEMPYWKNRLKPTGRPAGHGNGSATVPLASVARLTLRASGSVISVPPLNGAGKLANDTKSTASELGRAFVSCSSVLLPATRLPLPSSSGSPLRPALAKPSSGHCFSAVVKPTPEDVLQSTRQ